MPWAAPGQGCQILLKASVQRIQLALGAHLTEFATEKQMRRTDLALQRPSKALNSTLRLLRGFVPLFPLPPPELQPFSVFLLLPGSPKMWVAPVPLLFKRNLRFLSRLTASPNLRCPRSPPHPTAVWLQITNSAARANLLVFHNPFCFAFGRNLPIYLFETSIVSSASSYFLVPSDLCDKLFSMLPLMGMPFLPWPSKQLSQCPIQVQFAYLIG